MLRTIGQRLLALIPLLFLVSLVVFLLVTIIPGDPAVTLAGENASEARIAEIRDNLGLNDPLVTQYTDWMGSLFQGDLGKSLFSSRNVTDVIVERAPATISLTVGAVVFALLIGIPAGLIAGSRPGGAVDRALMVFATSGVALPSYFLAVLLILFFAQWNPWFPATQFTPLSDGFGPWLRSITLPAIALGTNGAALISRQLRSSLVEVYQQDYIRTARAKGIRPRFVLLKHAVKNAAIPTVTVLGLQIASLLGGTVVIETLFGISGLGQLAYLSVTQKDIPVIQGIVMVMALAVVVVNLIVDLLYLYLNPRVRT
ncbi:MAG: ABC transporter permease [Acidimicrobiales bacterium]